MNVTLAINVHGPFYIVDTSALEVSVLLLVNSHLLVLSFHQHPPIHHSLLVTKTTSILTSFVAIVLFAIRRSSAVVVRFQVKLKLTAPIPLLTNSFKLRHQPSFQGHLMDLRDFSLALLNLKVEWPVSAGNARRILTGFPEQCSQWSLSGPAVLRFRSYHTRCRQQSTCNVDTPSFLSSSLLVASQLIRVKLLGFAYSFSSTPYALSWKDSNIHAHAVHGHNLGENAAAARAFSFEVGLQFVIARATLLCATYPGGMAAVTASEEKAARYISKLGIDSRVTIAVYNGPESHVVSGEMKSVEKLIFVVNADGIRAMKLVVDQGFHSPSIAPALPALKAWLDEHEALFNVVEKPFFSTLRGKKIAKHEHLRSEYWGGLLTMLPFHSCALNRLTQTSHLYLRSGPIINLKAVIFNACIHRAAFFQRYSCRSGPPET